MRTITTGDMMHVHGGFGAGVDYTVRLTVRLTDPIDAEILQTALSKTQRRFPYLCVRMKKGEGAFYYVDNPLPVVILHADGRVNLGTDEVNGHLWAVSYDDDRLHLDCYHGITDGTGMYRVLATLLFYYCAERYGVTDANGIDLETDVIPAAETTDPQDLLPAIDLKTVPPAQYSPAFTLETDGALTPSEPTIWDIEVPEDLFMRFTSDNDASPGTMVSLLMARAIDSLYPDRSKEIISAYVINARPMLGARQTYHNCLGMAIFDYSDRIKAMPMPKQCTIYRGKTFVQSFDPIVKNSTTVSANSIRAAAAAAHTVEEKKQVFGQMFNAGEGLISFLVSYTGKWKHREIGEYMREFWLHPPNTFSLMVEIGAAGGKIFLSIQQRFLEDTIREAFLKQLEEHDIPYHICRKAGSDIAHFSESSVTTG